MGEVLVGDELEDLAGRLVHLVSRAPRPACANALLKTLGIVVDGHSPSTVCATPRAPIDVRIDVGAG